MDSAMSAKSDVIVDENSKETTSEGTLKRKRDDDKKVEEKSNNEDEKSSELEAAKKKAAEAEHSFTDCEIPSEQPYRDPSPDVLMFEAMIENKSMSNAYLNVSGGMRDKKLLELLAKLCQKDSIKKVYLMLQGHAGQVEGWGQDEVYPDGNIVDDHRDFDILVPFGKKGSDKLVFNCDAFPDYKGIWTNSDSDAKWMNDHFFTVKGLKFINHQPFFIED